MSEYIDADDLMYKLENAYDDEMSEFNREYAHGIEIAQHILEEIPAADVEPVRKWIPCSERLPEDRKCVLICYESGGEDIAWRNHGDWWVGFSMDCKRGGAVAWMPLPEPPKIDGGNEE